MLHLTYRVAGMKFRCYTKINCAHLIVGTQISYFHDEPFPGFNRSQVAANNLGAIFCVFFIVYYLIKIVYT
jgi:hypothetical protein